VTTRDEPSLRYYPFGFIQISHARESSSNIEYPAAPATIRHLNIVQEVYGGIRSWLQPVYWICNSSIQESKPSKNQEPRTSTRSPTRTHSLMPFLYELGSCHGPGGPNVQKIRPGQHITFDFAFLPEHGVPEYGLPCTAPFTSYLADAPPTGIAGAIPTTVSDAALCHWFPAIAHRYRVDDRVLFRLRTETNQSILM
jgi:hypothetical protein